MNVVVVSPTPSSLPLPPPGAKSPSLEQFRAEDIAKSLSVIEGEAYSKITQADYIAYLQGTPITMHIATAIETNKRLVSWVKGKIWRSGSVCLGEHLE